MTTKILRVNSSIFQNDGVSTQLINTLINKLSARSSNVSVTERNVTPDNSPHFSLSTIGALSTEPEKRSAEQSAIVDYADTLIEEVSSHDVIVIAAPMYNFAIPSTLKAWFDHIARAGVTFRYTENGPQGMLKDRPVYIVTTRGGLHQGQPTDTQTAYLTTMLNFIGLHDIRFIYAEGLNMSGHKEEAITHAEKAMDLAIAS